jgi:hypothetical protein
VTRPSLPFSSPSPFPFISTKGTIARRHKKEKTGASPYFRVTVFPYFRYIVERALLIVSEASRAIPGSLKEEHADIRWIGVRDIGNVIRRQYASLSPSLIWNIVRDELPQLRAAIEAIQRDLEA